MKQTAVEWLVQKLSKEWQLEARDLYLIEQAKEIFEKQLIDAHHRGWKVRKYGIDETAEQYYNENFKDKEL